MQARSFDVFLSHNSQDKPSVRQLADNLESSGVQVWLDERELVPGHSWQEALEDIVRTVKSAAVVIGRDGIGPWQDYEMRACLSAFVERGLVVIPVLLPGAPAKPDLPIFLKRFTWVDLRGGLTKEGIDRLVWGVTGVKPATIAENSDSAAPQTSLEATSSVEATIAANASVEQVVILIHGIHSLGTWHQAVERAIGNGTIRVVAPRYGWFPALRFIAPWDTSGGPMKRVLREFRDVRRAHPKARISVIAHSFGTHLLTRILQTYPEIAIYRVVLCGSVVKQDFDWGQVVDSIGIPNDTDKARYIVNDCGNHDAWPAISASAGWRYGNAGTDGFGSVFVRDRFHEGGHGLFFNKDFIETYWKPFLTDGTFVVGEAEQGDGVPWWIRLVSRLRLRYLQVLLPVLLVLLVIYAMTPKPKYLDLTIDQVVATIRAKEQQLVNASVAMKNASSVEKKDKELQQQKALQELSRFGNRYVGYTAVWRDCVIKGTEHSGDYSTLRLTSASEGDSTLPSRITAFFPRTRELEALVENEKIAIEGTIAGASVVSGIYLEDCRLLPTTIPQ